MLSLIAMAHGTRIARLVAQDFIHEHIRLATDGQRMAHGHQWRDCNANLDRVLTLMEENLEEPLSLATLVKASNMSQRQLERCFQRDLGTSLMRHYRNLRLNKARHLVVYSSMPVREVALACGYSGLAVFSRAYKVHFGCAPKDHRSKFLVESIFGFGVRSGQSAILV